MINDFHLFSILYFNIATVLIIFDALLVYLEDRLVELETNSFIIILAIFIVLVFSIISLAMQPRSTKKLSFQVPWVPLIPILSMFVNFYLMFKLSTTTWIRFAIWMAIGLSIYFFYGIWHSNERSRRYEARQNSAN